LGPFLAFVGAFSFNVGSSFPKVRLSSSSVLFSAMYFLGNSMRFHKGEWAWLHLFMLAQLLTSGIMVRKIQLFNWLMFGVWILAIAANSYHLLVLFDYVAATYFLVVAVASLSLPIKSGHQKHARRRQP
jgi:hypothetical protein